MSIKVYIAGNIAGKTPTSVVQYFKWKEEYLNERGYKCLNPLSGRVIDDKGNFIKYSPNDIVLRDLYQLSKSDVVVAEMDSTNSPGTCMELITARQLNKPIILVTRNEDVKNHFWIQYCTSKFCDTFQDAVEELNYYEF